jgi:hypothetical protein
MFAPFFTFLSSFVAILTPFIGSLVAQILVAGGFSVITYTGMSLLLESAMSEIINNLNGMPSDLVRIAGLLWLDKALNIVFSAMVLLMTLKGMSKAGTLSRGGFRAPTA